MGFDRLHVISFSIFVSQRVATLKDGGGSKEPLVSEYSGGRRESVTKTIFFLLVLGWFSICFLRAVIQYGTPTVKVCV